MDVIERLPLYVTCVLVTIIANLTSVQSHVCVFEKRPDPSRGGELRWSLPRSDVCYCQAVVAPQSFSSCPSGNDNYKDGDLWFVDDLRLLYQLTLRSNWQGEILDDLLQRTEYCADECTTMTHTCDDNAVCYDISGGFTCVCKTGYEGDGVACTEINECATNQHNCHENTGCSNVIGSFTCTCNYGHSGDGVACEDIDECETNRNNCHDNAECSNNIGSFTCTCEDGYSGDGVSCGDINECTTNTHNCHDNAECINNIGSFGCTCNDGYSGDGVSCESINECTTNQDNCHYKAVCSNSIGSFSCTCNVGYSGDGVSCGDINECTINEDNCHQNAECVNNIGSFSCRCNDGYSGDGVSCEAPACSDYMGVANGDIPNANMQASSGYAYNGRLNGRPFWYGGDAGDKPWIQANIGYQTNVTGVVTQGDGWGGYADFVASFKVSTFLSSSSSTERFVMNGDQVIIFPGNEDAINKKTSYFPEPIYAQIVRITCLDMGTDQFKMRFEILGCKNN